MKTNQYIIEAQFLANNIILGTEEYEVEATTEASAKSLVLGRVVGSHYNNNPNVTYKLKTLKVNYG